MKLRFGRSQRYHEALFDSNIRAFSTLFRMEEGEFRTFPREHATPTNAATTFRFLPAVADAFGKTRSRNATLLRYNTFSAFCIRLSKNRKPTRVASCQMRIAEEREDGAVRGAWQEISFRSPTRSAFLPRKLRNRRVAPTTARAAPQAPFAASTAARPIRSVKFHDMSFGSSFRWIRPRPARR